MARSVLVPRLALAEADLPAVCVRTGQPADARLRIKQRATPGWVWLLLPFGFLPFLVANIFAGETVIGMVPVNRSVIERQRRVRRVAALLMPTAIALVLAGVLASSPAAVWAGVAAGVASLGLYAYESRPGSGPALTARASGSVCLGSIPAS